VSLESYSAYFGIGSILAAVGAVATYFRGKMAQDEKIVKGFKEQDLRLLQIENKVQEIEVKQTVTDTRFNVFWGVIEKELPKILIRPHTPEIDSYLRKMRDGHCLNNEEKRDIIQRMREIIDNPTNMDDKILVSGYIWVIARFESELAADKKIKEQERVLGRRFF